MALRSNNYPSSEVKEVDLDTTPVTDSGSVVLAVGYASKGRTFFPTKIYGITSFINLFGAPMNDAEFYLYTTVERVLAKGGTPMVVRLPYNNDASANYTGVSLTFGEKTAIESAVGHTAMMAKAADKGFTHVWPITTDTVRVSNSEMALINSNGNFAEATDASVVAANFFIVDKNKSVCTNAEHRGGMFIVVFDPLRAMLVQRLLADGTTIEDNAILAGDIGLITSVRPYGSAAEISNWSMNLDGGLVEVLENSDGTTTTRTYGADSLSRQIAGLFPGFDSSIVSVDGSSSIEVDTSYANYIGIAVCRIDSSDSTVTKNVPIVVESFVGCVAPVRNKLTAMSEYIVDVINSRSSYISIYANRLNQTEIGQTTVSNGTMKYLPVAAGADALVYSMEANSDVSLTSFAYGSNDKIVVGGKVVADLSVVLNMLSDVDDQQIDVIADSGLSTIAQFASSTVEGEYFQPDSDIDSANGIIESTAQINAWNAVAARMEAFCSGTRKDCFAVIDAPRNATLNGAATIINEHDYSKTFANDLEPGFTQISSALNSSYAAIYSNWVKVYNPYTSSNMWVPPSCLVAAACAGCDLIFNPWNSPAYLERGVINGVIGISLYPKSAEESFLYAKSMNYIKYFSSDGYVIWGQKTTQKKEGAFSRINVRRSILRMERFIYQIGRRFIGKGNSVYNRRLWTDLVDPYLAAIKNSGGLYDYRLVCDDTNNTPEVIDANEFRCAVLLKPVREADFVVATVVVTNSGANFDEILSSGAF